MKIYKNKSFRFTDATADRYTYDSMSEQSWLNAAFWSIPLRRFTVFFRTHYSINNFLINHLACSWIDNSQIRTVFSLWKRVFSRFCLQYLSSPFLLGWFNAIAFNGKELQYHMVWCTVLLISAEYSVNF